MNNLLVLALTWFVLASAQAQIGSVDEPVEQNVSIAFSSGLFAKQGEIVLTEDEVEASLEAIPEAHRAGFLIDRRRFSKRIERMLQSRLIAQHALEAGILDDPLEAAMVYDVVMQVLSQRQLDRHMEDQMLDSYEQRAREFFLVNPDKYRVPDRYSFKHLLIREADRTDAEAARAILDLHDRLEEGADFDELVTEYGEDDGQPEDGYNNVPLADLDKGFAGVLSRMEREGQFAGPFRSKRGWHIIRLDGMEPGRKLEWDEAKEQAIEEARKRHREQIRERYIADLRDGKHVEVNEAAVKDLYIRHDLADYFEFD